MNEQLDRSANTSPTNKLASLDFTKWPQTTTLMGDLGPRNSIHPRELMMTYRNHGGLRCRTHSLTIYFNIKNKTDKDNVIILLVFVVIGK